MPLFTLRGLGLFQVPFRLGKPVFGAVRHKVFSLVLLQQCHINYHDVTKTTTGNINTKYSYYKRIRKRFIMESLALIEARLEILSSRDWNLPAIEARFQKLVDQGTTKKERRNEKITSQKDMILDRVQLRAEEYCHLTRNCAKGTATALLEEFGLGNMTLVKALAPFPGIALSGGLCGPVTGALTALGLYFTGDNIADFEDKRHYAAARRFLERFENIFGSLLCPDIQEILLGRYFDPMAGPENREAFDKAGARTKCPVAPGFGARIAAEIMIEGV
jgi:C_GCAxxG_C_C family probable redox protein